MHSHTGDKRQFYQGSFMSNNEKGGKRRVKLPTCLLQFSRINTHTVYAPIEKQEVSSESVIGLRFLMLCPESQICGTAFHMDVQHPENSPILTDPLLFCTTKAATVSESVNKEARASWHQMSFPDQNCPIEP